MGSTGRSAGSGPASCSRSTRARRSTVCRHEVHAEHLGQVSCSETAKSSAFAGLFDAPKRTRTSTRLSPDQALSLVTRLSHTSRSWGSRDLWLPAQERLDIAENDSPLVVGEAGDPAVTSSVQVGTFHRRTESAAVGQDTGYLPGLLRPYQANATPRRPAARSASSVGRAHRRPPTRRFARGSRTRPGFATAARLPATPN